MAKKKAQRMNPHIPKWAPLWQFDFQPLKVNKYPDLLVCRWRVTYCWKAFNEGYNFFLDITSIEGLNKKLWASKVVGVPKSRNSGFKLGSLEIKWHLGVGPMARHREYCKEESGGFPQIWAVVSIVSLCLHVVHLCMKNVPIMHLPTCCLVCTGLFE
jgi:hypothetical protein